MDPESFSPGSDPAFEVVPDPDPNHNLILGQAKNVTIADKF